MLVIDKTILEDLKATIENEDNEENKNKFNKSMLPLAKQRKNSGK